MYSRFWMRLTSFAGMGAKLLAKWNGASSGSCRSCTTVEVGIGALLVEETGTGGVRLPSAWEKMGGALDVGGSRLSAAKADGGASGLGRE